MFRVDPQHPHHRKVKQLRLLGRKAFFEASSVWLYAGCIADRCATNGVVTLDDITAAVGFECLGGIESLLSVGLFEELPPIVSPDKTGRRRKVRRFLFHDYLLYNEAAEEKESRRRTWRERKTGELAVGDVADDGEQLSAAPCASAGPPAVQDAARFLFTVLDRPRSAAEVHRLAAARGIAKPTLRKAKTHLGIVSIKRGREWLWSLREDDPSDHLPADHLDGSPSREGDPPADHLPLENAPSGMSTSPATSSALQPFTAPCGKVIRKREGDPEGDPSMHPVTDHLQCRAAVTTPDTTIESGLAAQMKVIRSGQGDLTSDHLPNPAAAKGVSQINTVLEKPHRVFDRGGMVRDFFSQNPQSQGISHPFSGSDPILKDLNQSANARARAREGVGEGDTDRSSPMREVEEAYRAFRERKKLGSWRPAGQRDHARLRHVGEVLTEEARLRGGVSVYELATSALLHGFAMDERAKQAGYPLSYFAHDPTRYLSRADAAVRRDRATVERVEAPAVSLPSADEVREEVARIEAILGVAKIRPEPSITVRPALAASSGRDES